MDNLTKKQRHFCMSKIRSKYTKPEVAVRKILNQLKIKYSLYSRKLPGKPDIVIPKKHKVIFINGCFWHQHKGCKRQVLPKTNKKYWLAKLRNNILRQKKCILELRKAKWSSIIVWECQIKKLNSLIRRLKRAVK